MAYYDDLSPYVYWEEDKGMSNVGWIDAQHDFRKGPVDRRLIDQLTIWATQPVNMTRGFHDCQFCDERSPIFAPTSLGGKLAMLGNGEIWVRHEGITYAAPTLIVHYVERHCYLPPDQFLAAVGAGHPVGEHS